MATTLSKEKLSALKNEVKMAENLNKEELEPILTESLQRYMGTFTPAYGADWDVVLNEIYPIIQFNLPSIMFRNPRAFLKPRNKTFIAKRRDPVSGKMIEMELDSSASARTQEYLLNYCISEIKYKRETRKVLLDALLFPFGVMWHGYKGDYGMTEESSYYIKDEQVFVKRVSPMRFIKDPAVNMANIDEARWVGRLIDVPLQDLLEDDKLDVDKKAIKGFLGYGDAVGSKKIAAGEQDYIKVGSPKRTLLEFSDVGYRNSKESRFVQIAEIYLRPTPKEKRNGDKGTIILLCNEQKDPLRINNWEPKAEGFPAKILQFNELNDPMFGLDDITTYKQIADQKNIVVNLQLRNAQENSKVWVALAKGNTNEEEIEHIQKGDQTIIAFEGDTVQGKMQVMSAGGQASSELYLLDQRIQKNLEDKSGVTDLKRGFLQSGEESAASVKLRAAGSSVRPAYRQDIMADFLKDSFGYILQLIKQYMPYNEAVRIVGSYDLEWSEKPTKEEIQAEVDVEIDVYSMLPEDPQTELQQLQAILQLMTTSLTTPQILQKLQQEGKTFEMAPVIEQMLLRLKMRNPSIFRNIKPEESQGFASVAELRAAKANVQAALAGNTQIPSPPAAGQDHRARLEVYTEIQQVIAGLGDTITKKILDTLVQMQAAIMQQEEEKQDNVGQNVKLSKPSVRST